jgi:dTDP-4-dehydrorhamnose reductase
MRPEFIINAAGFPSHLSVDSCDRSREEVLSANILLPQTVARVCLMTNTPWGHVSSGSIYQGAKVVCQGRIRIEEDLNRPEVRRLFIEHPEMICGFTEWDEPNFSFRHPPCNFYSGSKALAEEAIRGVGQGFIWRPRLLFNEWNDPRNLLWKIQNYPKVYDCINSISNLDDFVRACLELWEWQAPYGIYNVVNVGEVTTRQIVEAIQRTLKPNRRFEFWEDDAEFYRCWAKEPRSNNILEVSKLLGAGVKMRTAAEALEDALQQWQGQPTGEWTAMNALESADKNVDFRAAL